MDIEDAFNNTNFDVNRQALVERGFGRVVVRWIGSVTVEAGVCGHKAKLWVAKGCPQGGILSPILWCMVVDSLIRQSWSEESLKAR